jgi:N-formylmaleamate deformylase
MPFLRIRTLVALFLTAVLGGTAPAASTYVPSRFSVETIGTGPDVILIPGLTASRDIWRSTAAAVPGYRYHLVQVAGFAGAPAAGNARVPVVAPLAEEIARYISERGLVRPAVVGHSMGGTVALMVAARHPFRVGKVMVVDMLPEPAGLLGSSASEISGLADFLQSLTGTPGGRGLVESAIRMFGTDPAGDSRSDPDVVARAANELARIDLTRDLPKISAPLTVVYAAPRDPGVYDRRYHAAYAASPAARLVRVDRSGHMIMFDQPAAFRAAMRTFLGR